MIRDLTLHLEDNERVVLVTTEYLEAFSQWQGPLDVRMAQDPYREDFAEIELKRVSKLERVAG